MGLRSSLFAVRRMNANPAIFLLLGYNSDCTKLGRLAQMVERLPYTQNVGGSIPSAPTSFPVRIKAF